MAGDSAGSTAARASAHVSIAMGTGADVALDDAGVTLVLSPIAASAAMSLTSLLVIANALRLRTTSL